MVDMIEASSGPHFSGFHMNNLIARSTEIGQPTTSAAENIFKQPFVIGKSWHANLLWNRFSYFPLVH